MSNSETIQAAPAVGLKRRVASNFVWNAASEVGCKSLLFFSMIYLARVLGAENFGIFSFAQTVAMYFWLSADLGSNMYGAREAARERDAGGGSAFLNTLLSIRLTSGAVIFLAFIAFAFVKAGTPVERLVFLGFSSYMIFRAMYTEWYLRGLEKFNYIAIGNLATFSCLFALLVIFVRGREDVVTASFIWSASFLAGGVALLYMTKKAAPGHRFRFVFSKKEWLRHLKESVHFMVSSGLLQFYQQLPIFLLGLLAANEEVGLYSASHRLVFAIIFVFTVYPMAIYPVLSKLHKSDGAAFKKLYNFSLAGMVAAASVCSAALFMFSGPVCERLFGAEYAGSVGVLRVLSWFLLVRAVREVLYIAISSAGLQRFYTYAAGFGVASLIALFFGLRYAAGMDAMTSAAYSMVLTETGMLAVTFYIWHRKGSSC